MACWLALALCAALPGIAGAQISSAEDQYVEHIPDPRGDRPTNDDDASEGAPAASLPPRARAALARAGEPGEAALRAAQRSAPRAEAAPVRIEDAGEGTPPIAGIVDALLGDEEGMGVFLAGLMLASLLAAIAFAAQRRGAHR